MKFPVSMLRDFVTTSLDAEGLGDLLTMAGFELEGIEDGPDPVLEIKVMSNRGDGLSVFGLAREVLAKDSNSTPTPLYTHGAQGFPAPSAGDLHDRTGVSIECPDCHRFVVRCLEGNCAQPSPKAIQDRLTLAGMRPISLLVDLSNYVMLEIGQPMHAYDHDTLSEGRIVARKAKSGEKLTTLDGNEHELKDFMMVIADAQRPVGVAGVMGGLATEVTEKTTRVLLESANFLNTSVRKTRKALGLNTEASYRFERSVDPELALAATNRFIELLLEADPGFKVIPGSIDSYPRQPDIREVSVSLSRVNELLGMTVTETEALSYLQRLGFKAEVSGGILRAWSPTWRPDIVREVDIVEEIGRVHGFDRIPEMLPSGTSTFGGLSQEHARTRNLRDKLLRLGCDEIVSHSLGDVHPLDADHQRIGPRNPGSPEMAYLRNSLFPSLSEAARRNGGRDLALFEVGRIFWQEHGQVVERKSVGVLLNGSLLPQNRSNEPLPKADFFAMKGLLEALFGPMEVTVPDPVDPRLYPTRQARWGEVCLFGQIHPDIAEASGVPGDTVLAEIDLDAYSALSLVEIPYKPVSRTPSVRRDIAFVISKSLPYSQISNALELACGTLLERQWLFDVYEGKGIPEGSHSLAIALVLRKQGETFTDEEANQVREKAVAALEALGAKSR